MCIYAQPEVNTDDPYTHLHTQHDFQSSIWHGIVFPILAILFGTIQEIVSRYNSFFMVCIVPLTKHLAASQYRIAFPTENYGE